MKNLLYLLLPLILSSCFSYKEIEMSDVQSFSVSKIEGNAISVKTEIQVKNPNKYKIKVKKIEADVYLNGAKVGKITLNDKVILPANSDKLQEFNLNTQLSNVLSALPSLMFGGDVIVKLKGELTGKVFLFSKKYPIEAEQKVDPEELNLF